ncbi:MAG: hypothetical protein SFX74_03895 [Fimbriimonadaceae bacterium]|nr:hypothetical protein [Fimbriimonadaceae bacterium]
MPVRNITLPMFALGIVVSSAHAQAPTSLSTGGEANASVPAPVALGGTPAIDVLRLEGGSPSAPLRYGNVIPGSERIDLDGRALVAVTDYALDAEVGVIYLKRAFRPGQTLTVSYRYSDKPVSNGASVAKALSSMKLKLVSGGEGFGGLGFSAGLGVTERTADGRVLTGNAFGLNTNFRLGAASTMSGFYVVGNRNRAQNVAGMNFTGASGGQADGDTGTSRAVVQRLGAGALGGKLSFDYQDVSQNFTAFGSLRDNGADDAAIQRLRSERGMQRVGYAAEGLRFGNTSLSASTRKVSDRDGDIAWTSYGLEQKGLKLQYRGQDVGNTFGRFKDIAEQDREQLMRERGMKRDFLAGEFASRMGKLGFSSIRIEDKASGRDIARQEFQYELKNTKVSFGSQEVAQGFGRFDSLLGDERGRFGLEAGLSRSWANFSSDAFGKGTSFQFQRNDLASNGGKFAGQDLSLNAKTWSLSHSERSIDKAFAGFHAMQDGERQANVDKIARMYGADTAARPEDKHFLTMGHGIGRSATSLSAKPWKDWDVSFTRLQLTGAQDSGEVNSLRIARKGFEVHYRNQQLGERFDDVTRMLSFEKMRLGNVAGLDRTDFGMAVHLGGHKQFSFQNSRASNAEGGFNRTHVAFSDKKIDVRLNARDVDAGLRSFGQLTDPDRDVLLGLQGARQRDASFKWRILPNVDIEGFGQDIFHREQRSNDQIRNMSVNWGLDPKTSVSMVRTERKQTDSLSTMFSEIVERISLSRDFGRYGRLSLLDESVDFGGRDARAADRRRQYLSWETKLNPKTDLRAEQTRTDFSDGTNERVNANTVSTAVTKNLGVSVTDVNVDRHGDERDERKRNYGFWWDLGKGLRLSYGYNRQLVGDNGGTLNSTVAIGQHNGAVNPDQVGSVQASEIQGVRIGGAYGVNQWDQNNRTQAFTNFTFGSAKPIRFGPVQDFNFNFGMDQASDLSNWMRENRRASVNGRIGSNKFGYQYLSQMHQSGTRGIDRVFQIETDQDAKNPFRANVFYKVRTLPWNDSVMVRRYQLAYRPAKNLEFTHMLETNPEITRSDVFLGSLPQAARSSRWDLNWKRDSNFTLGGMWQELANDQTLARTRTAGVNFTWNEAKGSPFRLFYGLEQADGNVLQNTRHRYSIGFDQRPGPNQTLSFFLGNLSYEHAIVNGQSRNNWTFRLNYQLRFR